MTMPDAVHFVVVAACVALLTITSVFIGSAVVMACGDLWKRFRADRSRDALVSMAVALFVLFALIFMAVSLVAVLV